MLDNKLFDKENKEESFLNMKTCDKQNCLECKEIIHLIVDCEACDEQMARFKETISQCQECLDYFNNHKTILSIVKEKTGRKCCPDNVTTAILDSIKEIHI